MRSILITSAAAVISVLAVLPGAAQSDTLGVPGPISLEGDEYALAWTSQPSDNYFKQEYIPEGQAVESYEDMILVEAVIGAMTPMEAAAAQVQSLEARRGRDPVLNYEVIRNEATEEVLLDFLISDLGANPIIVEWNAYRYQALPDGDGVVLMGISRRGYDEAGAASFMSGLGAMRKEAIQALTAMSFPRVSIAP